MKTVVVLFTLFFTLFRLGFSQENFSSTRVSGKQEREDTLTLKNDPRRFIKILEYKRHGRFPRYARNSSNFTRAIYTFNDYATNISSRRGAYKLVDIDSEILIRFNHELMDNFRGNISLKARVNDRSVEVLPYAVVGEDNRDKIPISSAYPEDLSKSILNFLIELESLNRSLIILDSLSSASQPNDFSKKINEAILSIDLLTKYVGYFNGTLKTDGNRELKAIFLRMISISPESFDLFIDRINKWKILFGEKSFQLDTEAQNAYKLNYKSIANDLLQLTNKFLLVTSPNYLIEVIKIERREEYDRIYSKDNPFPSFINQNKLYRINESNFTRIKTMFLNYFKENIEKIIRQKYVEANIDLKSIGTKDGDELRIYCLWYDSRIGADPLVDEGLKKPLELLVITIKVKEIGWRMKVLDSFTLVNRIGGVRLDALQNISPSRFKGAPGASLVWNYGAPRIRGGIEPSIGLNISYLDFDTTKDLEIGVALIGGIFNNQLLTNFGYNIHAKNYPWYFSIGFSFINLAEKIKSWKQ